MNVKTIANIKLIIKSKTPGFGGFAVLIKEPALYHLHPYLFLRWNVFLPVLFF